MMPVEVDAPSRIPWDVVAQEDWMSILHHYVDQGITDFRPRSTTSRGCVLFVA